MALSRDRIYLALFVVYVVLLVFATVGEIFDIHAILDVFDLKRLFAAS